MAQKLDDGILLINPEAESALEEIKELLAVKEGFQFDTTRGMMILFSRAIIELESKLGGLDGK